ncbi:MAG: bifunctional metallophosphatase/5'-nucleotidase [Selenomonadaceae bacterium]|nr:bifunctional metallophosphatase/5'-nucleotidase [Selenomonadaceae bacterium]
MLKNFFGVLLTVCTLIFGSAVCSATQVVIFHTNDMHARIQDTDDGGKSIGLAQMAAAVKTIKEKNPATLWLDAGDTFHGLPVITMSKGENIVPILNEAGYDAMTAGNHDFNYGSKQLEKLVKGLNFPLLDANVVYKKGGKLLFTPYKIFELDGVKIGVFGLSTPECAYKTNPEGVKTIKFLNPVDTANKMIKILRPQCDVLIALMHMGVDASSEYTSERIARETEGIDIIIDGHSHTTFFDGELVNETLIAQTGCYEHYLGRVTLEVEDNKITYKKAELLDAEEVKAIAPEPDKKVLEILDKANAEAEKILSTVVGKSDRELKAETVFVRRNESELGNLTADAFRWATKSDIAIANAGGLRTGLPEGKITKRDVLAIFPFGDIVKVAEIQGSTIREMLEHSVEFYPSSFGGFLNVSGITFTYDSTLPPKQRVTEILINGKPLDEEKYYTIATIDFQFVGGDGYDMLKGLHMIGQFNTVDEIFAEYLDKVGMKNIKVGRITRLPKE